MTPFFKSFQRKCCFFFLVAIGHTCSFVFIAFNETGNGKIVSAIHCGQRMTSYIVQF